MARPSRKSLTIDQKAPFQESPVWPRVISGSSRSPPSSPKGYNKDQGINYLPRGGTYGSLRVQVLRLRGAVRVDAFDEGGRRTCGVPRVRRGRVAAFDLQLRLYHPRRLRPLHQPRYGRPYG